MCTEDNSCGGVCDNNDMSEVVDHLREKILRLEMKLLLHEYKHHNVCLVAKDRVL